MTNICVNLRRICANLRPHFRRFMTPNIWDAWSAGVSQIIGRHLPSKLGLFRRFAPAVDLRRPDDWTAEAVHWPEASRGTTSVGRMTPNIWGAPLVCGRVARAGRAL